MRLAHITDLHVQRPPGASELFNKRLLGAVNLYVLGRSGHFSATVQQAVPAAVLATHPDRVVCTGDLTATGTDAEFEAARALLGGLGTLPFDCIPGNHDVYTAESVGRYERYFGESGVRRLDIGPVDLTCINVCHPDWLSRGYADPPTLAALDQALAASDRPTLLALHYPLRNRLGEPYGPPTRALRNADAVEAMIDRHACVVAVLHGHEHHGLRTTVGVRQVPIYNPGACGYAWLPKKHRTAHFNVYEVGPAGIEQVERYAWNGAAFEPEPGGAYESGG